MCGTGDPMQLKTKDINHRFLMTMSLILKSDLALIIENRSENFKKIGCSIGEFCLFCSGKKQ